MGLRYYHNFHFLASRLSLDPASGVIRRHHLDESVLQKAIRNAARLAKIDKEVSTHTFRHSFGTQLIQKGYDTQHLRFWAGVRTIQAPLGHKDVRTTMIYTHVLQRGDWRLLAPPERSGVGSKALWTIELTFTN